MPSLVNSIVLPSDKPVVHSPLIDRILYLHSWFYRCTGYFSRFARYYESEALRQFVLSGGLEEACLSQADLEEPDSISVHASVYVGMWEARFGFYRKFRGGKIAVVDTGLETLPDDLEDLSGE